jgi:uncharacterized membrane protein
MKLQKRLFYFLDQIKSYFLKGVMVILPVAVTIFLFSFIFQFIKKILLPLKSIEPEVIKRIPHAEILIALILILFIGFIYKVFFLKPVLHFFENIIFKIPLVKPVYSGVKQLAKTMTDQNQLNYSKVILAEYPNSGSYCIGFYTGDCPDEISPEKNKKYVNVYIPTTPNPTTGFFILMPESKVIFVDLTRQEAMSLIISGGIIQPDRFKK